MHEAVERKQENADKIVIFMHGFMGSPIHFTDLMETAYEVGFSVASLLLPGHGKSGFSFAKSTLKQWETYFENRLAELSAYKQKYIVGHSIGGLLALNAAIKFDITGIVLISTPLKINLFKPKFWLKWMKLLFNRVDSEIKNAYKGSNSIGKPYYITMPLWPRVLLQPHKLMRKTRKNLSKITTPVLAIHSKGDETASIKSASLFDKLLVNSKHETVLLKESWHTYYTKPEKEIIKTKVSNFISN